MSAEPKSRSIVECCIAFCKEPALCRVKTETGWANVCEQHFPTINAVKRMSHSPVVEEIRKAYAKSSIYRRMNGDETIPGTLGAALPKTAE